MICVACRDHNIFLFVAKKTVISRSLPNKKSAQLDGLFSALSSGSVMADYYFRG